MWIRLILTVAILWAASFARALDITAQGEARMVIRTARPGSYAECVGDLERILSRMTAARLLIETGPPQPRWISVGTRDKALAGGAKDLTALANEEVLLTVQNECLLLLGGSPPGVSHAVYTWLDRLCCRWLMSGAIGESVRRVPSLGVEVHVSLRPVVQYALYLVRLGGEFARLWPARGDGKGRALRGTGIQMGRVDVQRCGQR